MRIDIKCPFCDHEFEIFKSVHNNDQNDYFETICNICSSNLIVYKVMQPTFKTYKKSEITCDKCNKITNSPKTKHNSELFPKKYLDGEKVLCKSCWMIVLYEEFFVN